MMNFRRNITYIASFMIITLLSTIFIPISMAQETKTSSNMKIDLSSYTKSKIEKNVPKPPPKELTIDDVLRMRANQIEQLIFIIQQLPDASFDNTHSKNSLVVKLQKIKQLVLVGADYGAYNGLNELKSDVKQSITNTLDQKKVIEFIDKIITSILIRTNSLATPPMVPTQHLSPLKQFELGVPIDKIICKDNLVLLQKIVIDKPACFKEKSVQKVIERGWGAKVITSSLVNTMDDK